MLSFEQIIALLGIIVSVATLVIAYWQLSKINRQISNANLSSFLTQEAEVYRRKKEYDDFVKMVSEIRILRDTSKDATDWEAHNSLLVPAVVRQEEAEKDYFDAIERLAFCFNTGLIVDEGFRRGLKKVIERIIPNTPRNRFGKQTEQSVQAYLRIL